MNYDLEGLTAKIYAGYPEVKDRAVVGITCNAEGEDYNVRQKYCEQVERAGGVPLLLPPTERALEMVDLCDAIIFTGGGDHNPLWMGEQPVPELHSINPVRDRYELTLCRLVYNRNIPMLGICRGMQTLAIALDGHVRQHISTSIKHSQDAPKTEATHSIEIKEGTVLYNIYKSTSTNQSTSPSGRLGGASSPSGNMGGASIYVNSFHHQAVDRVGERFRISAVAPDGVIEAMESAEYRSIMGVQWHPEQMGDDGLPVFQWLVREGMLFREAKALHQRILTIDSHCDTPMFFPQNVDFLTRDPRILYDLHKMDDGRIDAVQMVCYLPQPKIGERFSDLNDVHLQPLQYADHIFDKIEAICDDPRGQGRVSLARTPAELYNNKRHHRHSIVLGIENALALDHDIRNVQHFHQRGVTYITLCHNGDNDVCDSARGCSTHGGLSPFGRKVIAEMNRLGIMVDLSHAAETSFYQALETSTRPIVCSHSNCRALCDHPRNLTDDQMRALAQKGGVMQLTLYNGFLVKDGKATIDDFLRHLDHAISIMGIDHVGIGTDFDGDGGIIGLASAAELINVTIHLLRRGFSHRDIEKIWGGNWMRMM